MAKKGQKFNKYSEELKKEILDKYLSGISGGYLAKEYGISENTIRTWGKIAQWPDKYFKEGKRGRPKESEIDYKERYEILKKYRAFLKAQRERK